MIAKRRLSRPAQRALRAATLQAVHRSDGIIPEDLLAAFLRAGLVALDDDPHGTVTVTRDGYRQLHAALRKPYRATLAKLREGEPITLTELADLDLLSVTEVAELLRVSTGTVQALVRDNAIDHFRIHARCSRIPFGAVVEHLANRLTLRTPRQAPTPAPEPRPESRTA